MLNLITFMALLICGQLTKLHVGLCHFILCFIFCLSAGVQQPAGKSAPKKSRVTLMTINADLNSVTCNSRLWPEDGDNTLTL